MAALDKNVHERIERSVRKDVPMIPENDVSDGLKTGQGLLTGTENRVGHIGHRVKKVSSRGPL